MNMLEKITQDEMSYFHRRCVECGEASSYTASARDILSSVWAVQKEKLFHLFGDELILSKEVDFEASDALFATRFNERMVYDCDSAISAFLRALSNRINAWNIYQMNGSYDLSYFIERLDGNILASNRMPYAMNGILPNDVKINAPAGAKVIRVLGKYAEAYGLQNEFEAFRLEHSQILNTKKFTGELCISIHPLDFSTMSDNDNDWGSCMSWWDEGEYRAGTIEMMNSNCVVVAYLRDTKRSIDNGQWNSKKWRELFVITEDLIAGIKGYPYQSSMLEMEVINWLRELAVSAWGIDYAEPAEKQVKGTYNELDEFGKTYHFTTDTMYNDFRHRNDAGTHLIATNPKSENEHIDVYYSGPRQCMACGSLHGDYEHEGSLCCDDCAYPDASNRQYCSDCGYCLHYTDEQYWLDGECYCSSCYNELCTDDFFMREKFNHNNATQVYIVPDLEKFKEVCNAHNKKIDIWRFESFELALHNYTLPNYIDTPEWQEIFGEAKPEVVQGVPFCSYYVMPLSAFVDGQDNDTTRDFMDYHCLNNIFTEDYKKYTDQALADAM